MTCDLKRPAPQDLFNRYRDLFSANVMGGAQIIPESNEWYVISNDYLIAEEFYSIAEQQWRERDPRYACCDNLVKMAADDKVFPRAATYASGYMQFTGTPGTAIPAGALVVLAGQQYFQPAPGVSVPPVMPADGRLIIRMVARTSGAIDTTISSARLVATVAGIDQVVTVAGGKVCGGKAAETCEEFRARYLARKQYQPRMTFQWIKHTVAEWPCATRVCLYECDCCPDLGRMDMWVFFDGTFENGIAPQNVVDEMTAWFFGSPQGRGLGEAEWGLYGAFHSATAVKLDITVTDLPCTSTAQLQDLRTRIAGMFGNLCPGKQFCSKMVEAVITQALGAACDMNVTMRPADAATFCGEFNPKCNEVPVLGTLKLSGGSLTL